MRKSGMRLSGDWESFSPIRMKESKGRSGGPGRNEEMKKAVVCEKEERKRQRKVALCNLRAKKRWKFWEKRLWILFWLAILRNARTASSTTLWGCTVAGCTDYDVSDGFSDSNTDWKILLFKEERTASCKLYPRSFCDFSSGIGGDIIRFASAVLGLNNWEACRYLIEAFSLPFSLSGHTDNREQIRRREQERQRQQEKERRFKAAWVAEADRLKTWENVYQRAITEKVFPPLSDLQTFTVGELQKVSYELDVLCIYGSRREQEAILISEGWEL